MSTVASPDWVAFARDLLLELRPGTALEDVPIDADRSNHESPPFILLGEAPGSVRDPYIGAYMPARLELRSAGNSEEEAAAGYRAASDLLHMRGPLVRPAGKLWKAFDETGPQMTEDPDTKWPIAFGVFDLYMADR